MSPGRRDHRVDFALLAAAAVLALLFHLRGPLSPEDVPAVVVAMVWHGRQLLEGTYPFWNPDLGFGMPHPMQPSIIHHPLVLLFGLLDMRTAIGLFYVVQLCLGVSFFGRLCRRLGFSPRLTLVCGLSWLLSGPILTNINNFIGASSITVFTLFPVVLYYLVRVVEGDPHRLRRGLALGLAAGLLYADGHPGIVSGHVFAAVVVVVVKGRAAWRARIPLALAGATALLVAGQNMVHFVTESGFFEPDLPRNFVFFNHFSEIVFAAWGKPIFRPPLGELAAAVSGQGWGEALRLLAAAYIRANFVPNETQLGLPFAWIAAAALFWRGATHSWRWPLAAAAAACLAGVMLPYSVFHLLIWYAVLANAAVPFAILLAGIVLQQLEAMGRLRSVSQALAAQVALLGLAALPTLLMIAVPDGLARTGLVEDGYVGRVARLARSGDLRPGGLAAETRRLSPRPRPRVYLSPATEAGMMFLSFDRNYGWDEIKNVLSVEGLRPVNGVFKGMSVASWHPSWQRMYGHILGQTTVLTDQAALDVLGIDVVLADPAEPRSPGLVRLGSVRRPDGAVTEILGNPGAWPEAAVVPAWFRGAALSRRPDCGHDRLLCADFTAAQAAAGSIQPVAVEQVGDGFLLRLAPDAAARVVMVAQSFRPEWRATTADGGRLEVFPALEGFVGIAVPPSKEVVRLRFVPTVRMATALGSNLTILAAAVALFALHRRRRRHVEEC